MRWNRFRSGPRLHPARACGVTLIELLCVMVIIGILASMLLPVLSRSYGRVKGMAEEMEAPGIQELLLKETRGYCVANPNFAFTNKQDFEDQCTLAPKCRDWVEASRTEFVPFSYLAPSNEVVLAVHIGRNHKVLYAFSKAELSTWPERH